MNIYQRLRAHIGPNLTMWLVLSLVAAYLAVPHTRLHIPDIGPVSAATSTHPLTEATTIELPRTQLPGSTDTQASTVGDSPATVYQSHQDNSFSLFALTWHSDTENLHAHFRAQKSDGSWGPWYEAETLDGAGDTTLRGTELVYVEKTNTIQIYFDNPTEMHNVTGLTMNFLDGRSQQGIAPTAYTTTEGLRLIPRSAWGADESIRCEAPTYDDKISAITIHHTAGSNNYSPNEAAGIVRGIYTYHAQTLGWCDIGYQSLVDRYGNIYEGTYGGFDKAVQGAHAGGFNENTWAISMMGTFSTETPTTDMINAVGNLAGWKAAISGFDPTGTDTHISEGTSYTSIPKGQSIVLPNIFAHRDVDNTECPGDAAYAQMGTIRTIAKERYTNTRNGLASTLLTMVGADTRNSLGLDQGTTTAFSIIGIIILILLGIGIFGSTSANHPSTTAAAA